MRKTMGIIGGMSPESTLVYYEHIHRTYRESRHDVNYPTVLIYSVPFEDCRRWTVEQAWDEAGEALGAAAEALHSAGADFALIATNTMHIAFDIAQRRSPVPLMHIVDVTAEAIVAQGVKKIGLLGTRTTMQHPMYPQRLSAYGLHTLVPTEEQQEFVNRTIYNELTQGEVLPASRASFLEIIHDLERRGAQGVILGCTEIPLLIRQQDLALPVFDTARLHAEAALAMALGEDTETPGANQGG